MTYVVVLLVVLVLAALALAFRFFTAGHGVEYDPVGYICPRCRSFFESLYTEWQWSGEKCSNCGLLVNTSGATKISKSAFEWQRQAEKGWTLDELAEKRERWVEMFGEKEAEKFDDWVKTHLTQAVPHRSEAPPARLPSSRLP